MGWKQKKSTGSILVLGDDTAKGEVPEVTGELVEIRPSTQFPNNKLFDVMTTEGRVTVAGCATLNERLTEAEIGHEVKLRFVGWGKSKKGSKFRAIEVDVWEPEPDNV